MGLLRMPTATAADPPSPTEKQPASPKTGTPAIDPPAEDDSEEPDEEPELPFIDDMPLPTVRQLLEAPPRDWIVLTSKKVLEVEPLQPRPGTLEALRTRIQDSLRGGILPDESEADKNRRMALFYLPVTLIEDIGITDQQYRLHQKYIREIVYHEDLVLRRIDRLLDESKVRQAFELLLMLDRQSPKWAGLRNRHERLLWVEAAVQLERDLPQQAFVRLEELHHRNASYPGLMLKLGSVTDALVTAAVDSHDYRQARFFLRRLRDVQAGHAVASRWSNRLQQLAEAHLQAATIAERQGDPRTAVDEIQQAATIWPQLAQLAIVYNRMAAGYQRLLVGVQSLPAPQPNWPANAADRRQNRLLQTELFEPIAVTHKIARYRSRLLEDWEPTDLGHSVVFRLRAPDSTGRGDVFTSGGLLELLSRRLQAGRAQYDDRFANAVAGLSVRNPQELVVEFRQPPLRPEALFSFPLAATTGPQPAVLPSAAEDEAAVFGEVDPPYVLRERQVDRVTYRRRSPTPAGPRVAEIVERRYSGPEEALRGLVRGEVSLLPRVPPWLVRPLEQHAEFNIQPYAVPVTHVLQFHPRNAVLRNRTLRRALMYALDREYLLVDHFLHEAPGRFGRPTSAPFPTTSYAYETLVKPHSHDVVLGAALAIAAEKELGPLPELRLVYPDDPQIAQAADAIIAAWQRIGVDCRGIPATVQTTDSDGPTWDIAYRCVQMVEPLVELWPFLTVTSATDIASLEFLPGSLRRELLVLDRAGDWATAEQTLHRLHRQLWADVHLIPLWELSETMVWRKHVRGIPPQPVETYQQMEGWNVEPWYSPE
jgi:hypothetical protein